MPDKSKKQPADNKVGDTQIESISAAETPTENKPALVDADIVTSFEEASDPNVAQAIRAVVMGEVLGECPKDLFIPPKALEVVLDSFEGPLDLLLYLIRKQNFEILDIPVASITEQYMAYVELMRSANLDLAADYLVMAALLGEIKSRLLLPKPKIDDDDEEDPRAALIRRLQEYERFSEAANELDLRPRVGRDIHVSSVEFEYQDDEEELPNVSLQQLVSAYQGVLRRASERKRMHVTREVLSMREKMTSILFKLKTNDHLRFEDLFIVAEGRMGIVVTFIALLELYRDRMLVVIQNEPFAPIHIRAAKAV